MAEIKTNIIHLKTYLHDLELQTTNLIDNRVKSSAPKARAIAQKMKLILQELRTDIQKNASEVPVKNRVKKLEGSEVSVKAVEPALLPEKTVEIPQMEVALKKKTVRKKSSPVSKN